MTYDKNIAYDRQTRDYRMELDGRLIGFARSYHEAEAQLDQVVYEMLTHGDFASATELDGGGQPDTYTLAADAGLFGPQAPAFDINNSEYCPKHETWFGRMPCPACYEEARQPKPVCATCGGAVECSQPDNLCDVHNPCPAHAADAARYLAERRVIIGRPCPTCGDEGDCPDCGTYVTPLLTDCLNVIDMALGHTYGAASVVSELRRIKARLAAVCDAARV
jgi:hypothetical protein